MEFAWPAAVRTRRSESRQGAAAAERFLSRSRLPDDRERRPRLPHGSAADSRLPERLKPQHRGPGSASAACRSSPTPPGGQAERLAYYGARKLNHLPDSLLDYHDVLHGRETPAERRSRKRTRHRPPPLAAPPGSRSTHQNDARRRRAGPCRSHTRLLRVLLMAQGSKPARFRRTLRLLRDNNSRATP